MATLTNGVRNATKPACALLVAMALFGVTAPRAHAWPARKPKSKPSQTIQSIVQIGFNTVYAPIFILNWGDAGVTLVLLNNISQTNTQSGAQIIQLGSQND